MKRSNQCKGNYYELSRLACRFVLCSHLDAYM